MVSVHRSRESPCRPGQTILPRASRSWPPESMTEATNELRQAVHTLWLSAHVVAELAATSSAHTRQAVLLVPDDDELIAVAAAASFVQGGAKHCVFAG